MLQIIVPAREYYDDVHNEFINTKEQKINLEHSLVSLAKWESKWHKPFLNSKEQKSMDEIRDYIRCMTLTQNVDPKVYYSLTAENYKDIQDYIDNPMTATTFSNQKQGPPNREIITNELIYYWMTAYQIPVEFEKWHLNRLLTLIRVCSIKNAPPKKMSKGDILKSNASLNAARRKAYHTKG